MSEDIEPVATHDGQAARPPGSAVGKARRQRRPTGAPPPLPRPIVVTTAAWLVLVVVALTGATLTVLYTPWLRLDDRINTAALRALSGVRTSWLTDLANGIKAAGGWGVTALGLTVLALTAVFRRWRHLLVFLGSLFFLQLVGTSIYFGLSRPRPYGVPIITSWGGYSAPSPPASILTFFLVGAAYCLVVPGRPRRYAKAVIAAVIAVFCLARLYLGVDHLDDVFFGVVLAVAIPVTAFRFFTPNEVFPVAYRRGRTAHVDVTGRRAAAIRQAMRDQLGLTVTEIKPVGLESSAGSTPLRLRVQGGPDQFLFAKLYTKGHVRADRWYKLWRTILYGSLEDESPFQTVRRLVTYEDYALRLLQDIGVRTARPYGIVEITPEREYMLVTEFHRRRRRDRRGRRRRRGDRPGAGADPHAVGRRDRPPRHQAGQPDGPRRGAAADRRGLRPGAPVAVAAGGRPGQHDAGPGGAQRPAAGLPARAALFHRGRAGRGVRRHPRGGQPDPAARLHETGPARPARRVPRPRPAAAADRAATLEHQAGEPGRWECSLSSASPRL